MDHPTESLTMTEEASQPFVGRWNRLISTTNWEKGRIVHQWRCALVAGDAPSTEYSDEAWSRRVGGVTGQHVGRLRRVYERFGDVYQDYEGLYWSHFQAALEWDDAEMWLEGAVQSHWSVSQMRRQRWEATGAVKDEEPKDSDIQSVDLDEDHLADGEEERKSATARHHPADDEPRSPAGPDFGDEQDHVVPGPFATDESHVQAAVAEIKPFEDVAALPSDLADAFEAFRLAILNHKAEQWQQVPLSNVLQCLDALKTLAEAPA